MTSISQANSRIKSFAFTAMASPCQLHIPCSEVERLGEQKVQLIAQQVEQEVIRIEQKYSRYRADSLLSKINSGVETKLDQETLGLLNYADVAFQISDGLFDISSGIFRQVWDFKQARLPSEQQLSDTLKLIGWQKIQLTDQVIKLPSAMQIDFGGIGKEYAADQAADILRGAGIHAFLVDLGGDIVAFASDDFPPWQIGIRNPQAPNQALASIAVQQGAVATSGNYERFFIKDGQHYCHILNAKTGWPVDHWASVTCIAERCIVAGSLATVAMLKQAEAIDWLQQMQIQFLAVDKQNRIVKG